MLLLGCAGLGTDSGGAVDPVDYIEVLPILTRDTTTGARRVTIWTGLLVAGEAPDLEAQALEEVGEGAWLVKGANAAMTLFPTRDFTVVGAPALVLLPDQAGSVTVGRVGEEDELESGYRLEVTAAPAEDDGVRLSVRFIQSEAGVEVRTVRDVDVVVPKRGSLFLATRATEAALR